MSGKIHMLVEGVEYQYEYKMCGLSKYKVNCTYYEESNMTRVCDKWYGYSAAVTLNVRILLSTYPLKPIWIVQEGRHALLNTTPDGADLLASSFVRFVFKD